MLISLHEVTVLQSLIIGTQQLCHPIFDGKCLESWQPISSLFVSGMSMFSPYFMNQFLIAISLYFFKAILRCERLDCSKNRRNEKNQIFGKEF
jgi:hypothetical protein